METLKPCRWRGPGRGGRFTCRSNRLIGGAAGVSAEFCNGKCPYVDHEPVAGPALRNAGPCAYLRGETGELENCDSCAGRVRLKVFNCELHGAIVPDRKCNLCGDYEPPAVKSTYEILPGLPDPLPYAPIAHSHKEWAMLPRVQRKFIDAFKRVVGCQLPRIDHAEGDGIVICGGGKYWPMIAIACHMARRVTNLPIQIWHRGADEPVKSADIRGLHSITFHDSSKVPGLRRLGG